jgi:hypothetical protein
MSPLYRPVPAAPSTRHENEQEHIIWKKMLAHILRCVRRFEAIADWKAEAKRETERQGLLDGWILIIITRMRLVFQGLMGRLCPLIEGQKTRRLAEKKYYGIVFGNYR